MVLFRYNGAARSLRGLVKDKDPSVQYECSQCGYGFEPFADDAAGPFCDCPRCGGLAVESQSGGAAAAPQAPAQRGQADADMRQTLDPFHGHTGARPLSPGLFENYFESSEPSIPSAPPAPEQQRDPFDDVIASREFDPGDIHREPTMLLGHDQDLPQAPSALPSSAAFGHQQDLPVPPRHSSKPAGFHNEVTSLAQDAIPLAPKPITGIMPTASFAEPPANPADWDDDDDEFVDDDNEFSNPAFASNIVGIEESPDLERSEVIAQARLRQALAETSADIGAELDPEALQAFAQDVGPNSLKSDPDPDRWGEDGDDDYDDDDDDDATQVTQNPGAFVDDEVQDSREGFEGLPLPPTFSALLEGQDEVPASAQLDPDEASFHDAFGGDDGMNEDEATRGERPFLQPGAHSAEMLAAGPGFHDEADQAGRAQGLVSGEMLISSEGGAVNEDRHDQDAWPGEEEPSMELDDGEMAEFATAANSQAEHSGDWMVSGPARPPALPKRRPTENNPPNAGYAKLDEVSFPSLAPPPEMDEPAREDLPKQARQGGISKRTAPKDVAEKRGPRPSRRERDKDKPKRLFSAANLMLLLGVALISLVLGGGSAFWMVNSANKVANLSGPAKARKLLGEANKLLAAGDDDEAIALLKRAAIDDPTLAAVQRSLGAAYARQKREAEAAKAYEYYVRMAPSADDAAQIREILAKHRGES